MAVYIEGNGRSPYNRAAVLACARELESLLAMADATQTLDFNRCIWSVEDPLTGHIEQATFDLLVTGDLDKVADELKRRFAAQAEGEQ